MITFFTRIQVLITLADPEKCDTDHHVISQCHACHNLLRCHIDKFTFIKFCIIRDEHELNAVKGKAVSTMAFDKTLTKIQRNF